MLSRRSQGVKKSTRQLKERQHRGSPECRHSGSLGCWHHGFPGCPAQTQDLPHHGQTLVPHLPSPKIASNKTRSPDACPSTTPKPYLQGRQDENPKGDPQGNILPRPTCSIPGGPEGDAGAPALGSSSRSHPARPWGRDMGQMGSCPANPSPLPKVRGLLISLPF